jgi:predicted glutamine amidotransferase
MCIICCKPLNKRLPKEQYSNMFSANSDGAGFCYMEDGELLIAKGFFTFDDFWNFYEPLEEKAILIHFRIGTSGGNNGENCHPWLITDKREGAPHDLVFVHNGVIPIDRRNQSLSDTGNFNEDILKELAKDYPDFWKQKEFKWMIESAIGSGNKLVIADETGHCEIFNEKAGVWRDDVWFSNNTFSYARTTYGSCTSPYGTNYNTPTTPPKQTFALPSTESTITLDELKKIDTTKIDEELEKAESARIASLS